MFGWNEIEKEFDYRHEFDDSELDILIERWPSVKFSRIPLAWIIIIDDMLSRLRYNKPIYEIRQEFGHLIILSRPLSDNQRKIIQHAEEQLYLIDTDLHVFLNIRHIDNKALH